MEPTINFKDIFLSTSDLENLANARNGNVINVHPVSAEFLINYGFISFYAFSDIDHEFVITPLGVQYLEYLDNVLLEKDKEEEHRKKEERRLKFAGIRSWISVLISLIALICSLLQWLSPTTR